MWTEKIRTMLIAPKAEWADALCRKLEGAQLEYGKEETGFPLEIRDFLAAPCERTGAQDDAVDAALVLVSASTEGANSLEFLETFRQLRPNVPVVIAMEKWEEKTALRALELGAEECLRAAEVSDFRGCHLVRAIRFAIHRRQLADKARQTARQLREDNRRLTGYSERLSQLCSTAHQFVDNVSHEFRTPLSVIKEYCSLTRDGLAGRVSDRQQEFLDIALARVEDLTMLVDDMLDASKMETGLLRVRRRRRAVRELIETVHNALRRRFQQKQISLEIELEDDLPEVYCDADKFTRVLLNLIVNAMKFSPAQGKIIVRGVLYPRSAQVHVSVTDQGPGIEPEKLNVLFERFRQLDNGAKSPIKGFGLGLNIARELVALNLGEIRVKSQPGQGSTFSFTTPTADPLGVIRCYLGRFGGRGETPYVSLVEARLKFASDRAACDPSVSEEADEFLQTYVRAEDFVYQAADNRWIVALRCGAADVERVVARLKKQWSQTSYNRVAGALPGLLLSHQGTWRGDVQPTALCARFVATATGETGKTSKGALRVLLVDDDPELVQALDLRMQAAGYQVTTAADGELCILAARDRRPDAIVLDARHPGEEGLKTLTQLKSDSATKDIPVVMLSASLSDQQQALEQGARFFLPKPYDALNVVSAVQSSLEETPVSIRNGNS